MKIAMDDAGAAPCILMMSDLAATVCNVAGRDGAAPGNLDSPGNS